MLLLRLHPRGGLEIDLAPPRPGDLTLSKKASNSSARRSAGAKPLTCTFAKAAPTSECERPVVDVSAGPVQHLSDRSAGCVVGWVTLGDPRPQDHARSLVQSAGRRRFTGPDRGQAGWHVGGGDLRVRLFVDGPRGTGKACVLFPPAHLNMPIGG